MASNEKLHLSVCPRRFRKLKKPAPKAEGPCWGTMAANVEVTNRTARLKMRITSGGNVLFLFIGLLHIDSYDWAILARANTVNRRLLYPVTEDVNRGILIANEGRLFKPIGRKCRKAVDVDDVKDYPLGK